MSALLAQVVEHIDEAVDTTAVSTWDPLWALITLVAGVGLSRAARVASRRIGQSVDLPANMVDLLGTAVMWTVVAVSVVFALTFVGLDVTPLWLLILIVAVVFVVGGRTLLEAFGAGILLQARAPFRPGDLIFVGEERGVVHEVNSRTVVLDTFDGRRIHLPNAKVLAEPIVNLTHRNVRMSSLLLDVVYGTDLGLACRVAVASLGDLHEVATEPPPVAEVRTFEPSSVRIRLRFWHSADETAEFAAVDAAAQSVYAAYEAEGIEWAFPQQTLWWGRDDDSEPAPDPRRRDAGTG